MTNQEQLFFEQHLPFWKWLSDEQKQFLLQHVNKKVIPQGILIQSSAEQCLGVLLLEQGSLRIFMVSEEGKEATLFRLGDGEMCVLSASCIMDPIDFDISIETFTETSLFSIDISSFKRLAEQNIHVECFMYKWATERFSDVIWAMQQILFSDFNQRLANFLYNEMLNRKSMELKITHDEIARNIGSAREVVSRVLKKFVKDEIVHSQRGLVNIVNVEKLKSLL